MAFTTINNGSLFMNPKIYTGNGGTQTITDVNFEPDLIVTKGRDLGESPWWTDKVVGLTKYRYSDGNAVDSTYTTAVTGTNSDGYVLGNRNGFNNNTNTFVSWNWKAGTAVSGNTGGSGTYKTYTGSVNTTSGFSIIQYTGNGTLGHTIPHHLGVAPSMMIIKITAGDTSDWYVYHKDLGNTGILFLSNTNAVSNSNAYWNSTTPTSSVFTVGDQTGNNSNNNTFISYNFAEVPGFSKMGSYVGNGNADGTFVYTGFKPAFVMFKMTSEAQNWGIYDNKRVGYNEVKNVLFPNLSNAENTDLAPIDLLSNGFKMRRDASASDQNNKSGGTYIYMAFAEAPLVGTNNIPANAR